MPPPLLKGKIALVTGASRRLGRSIALALAAAGSGVILHYHRSRREAEELRRILEREGARAWTVQADLSSEAVDSLLGRAWDLSGGIDILVNNASIFPRQPLSELNRKTLEENIRINAWAPFALCRAFTARAKRGQIVNLLDTRIRSRDLQHGGYWLSKIMLFHLTRAGALAWAPRFTVNAVAPGLILPPPGETDAYLERMKRTVPLRRRGTPEEVVAAVLFLLQSTFITGQVIYVDGGRHLLEDAHG